MASELGRFGRYSPREYMGISPAIDAGLRFWRRFGLTVTVWRLPLRFEPDEWRRAEAAAGKSRYNEYADR